MYTILFFAGTISPAGSPRRLSAQFGPGGSQKLSVAVKGIGGQVDDGGPVPVRIGIVHGNGFHAGTTGRLDADQGVLEDKALRRRGPKIVQGL